MADWVVGTHVTFSPLTSAVNSSGLVSGKYWTGHVAVGAGVFERRRIQLPGLDQIKIKRYGSRGRPINGEVLYINTTFSNVFSALEADRSFLENEEFPVTPPQGTVWANCELVSFEEVQTYFGADGKYLLKAALSLFCLD